MKKIINEIAAVSHEIKTGIVFYIDSRDLKKDMSLIIAGIHKIAFMVISVSVLYKLICNIIWGA